MLQSLFTWIFYLFRELRVIHGTQQSLLQSLFTWIFYLFDQKISYINTELELQSLFTWIFYLFKRVVALKDWIQELQSLFTWIFYLFQKNPFDGHVSTFASILIHLDFLSIYRRRNLYLWQSNASILIHLDFLSICGNIVGCKSLRRRFNPYSPGFSIYLEELRIEQDEKMIASILIHLDFLSI